MKSALLIIDVQEALCTGKWAMADIDRVVDRINPLAEKIRAAGGIVVLVQHEEPDSPLQPEAPGWRVYHRVETRPEDFRVRKASSDAFHQTELLGLLAAQGIDRLVICGLQSELCVDSTVRGALAHDYPVVLVADAHTTLDGGGLSAAQISAHHNYALANVASPDAKVTVVPAADVAA
jgi:nicotinamidase-related amidase